MTDSNTKHKHFLLGLGLACLLWLVFMLLMPTQKLPEIQADYSQDIEKLPDFSAYQDTQEKKQAFFDFLYPIIEQENRLILTIRQQLELLKASGGTFSPAEQDWLANLSAQYEIEETNLDDQISKLLKRVDLIPPSLVLTQAAIESGWGTSRFARQANNLFGHWCFEKGCGVVPSKRDANKQHEVAKFKSVNASIRAYYKNLNTFYRYGSFRNLREKHRKDILPDVLQLLPGLLAYSELGEAYLKKLKRFIKQNNLSDYDQLFLSQLDAQSQNN